MHAVKPDPTTLIARFSALADSPTFTGQEIDGIEEGLHFYTRAKQNAGINVLQDVDLSRRADPSNDVRSALKTFTHGYNVGLPEGERIQCGPYVATVHSNDAQNYQKIFPIAKKFLQMNLETFLPADISPLAKARVTAIHDAAYIFVHGFSKYAARGTVDGGYYLDFEIGDKNKVTVKPWVQV
jgi:hypothetical protein